MSDEFSNAPGGALTEESLERMLIELRTNRSLTIPKPFKIFPPDMPPEEMERWSKE